MTDSLNLDDTSAEQLGVVIVSFNSADDLGPCLDSLADAGSVRCVVVDNGSTDASVQIAQNHPVVEHVVCADDNRGYAAGINAGAALLPAELDLVVLNPDCRLAAGSLGRLRDALGDGVGIAAPQIRSSDRALDYSLHHDPTIGRALADAVLGTGLASRLKLSEEVREPAAYEHPHDVDWASGAALLISADCRRDVGDWNESYFLYSEEVDYQLTARRAGHRIRYVPDAVVEHAGGDSRVSPYLWSILCVNRVRCYRRFHSRVSTAGFRTVVMMREAVRAAAGRPTSRAALRALRNDVRPDEVGEHP